MKVGRKRSYDTSKFPEILNSVKRARGSIGQIADFNHIARQTLRDWISYGDEDTENGLSTDIGQFSCSLREKQSEIVMELCETALENEKKAKFIMWWLGMICREDFGAEGMELKELRDIFKFILPLIGKGDLIRGQEAKEGRETQEEESV